MQPTQPNPQVNIDPKDAVVQECRVCKNDLFEQKIEIRKVSALLSPTGKEMWLQNPVMVCSECGARWDHES